MDAILLKIIGLNLFCRFWHGSGTLRHQSFVLPYGAGHMGRQKCRPNGLINLINRLICLNMFAYLLFGFARFAKYLPLGISKWHVAPLRFAPAFRALGVCEFIWPFSRRSIWERLLSPKTAEIFVAHMTSYETTLALEQGL